jgi:hypothetical protein
MMLARTTLTLDDDLAQQLQERARRSGETFKSVLNATLRRGLRAEERPSRLPKFVVKSKACGFQPGIDVLRLNQLNDELGMEELRLKVAKGLASG